MIKFLVVPLAVSLSGCTVYMGDSKTINEVNKSKGNQPMVIQRPTTRFEPKLMHEVNVCFPRIERCLDYL